jgi:TetR/AcrR family transcriptional regulator
MSSPNEKEKIAAILEASRKRFGHFGLAKTTMAEIATDIGMSKASLYYYFPDKEHLFVAVITREMDTFIEVMQKVINSPDSSAEKLHHYVSQRLTYFQQFISLGKIVATSLESLKPAFAKFHDEFAIRERTIIREILQSGIDSKEFTAMDPVMYADFFVSALQGFRTHLLKQRDSYLLTPADYSNLGDYHTLFTTIFIKGISK